MNVRKKRGDEKRAVRKHKIYLLNNNKKSCKLETRPSGNCIEQALDEKISSQINNGVSEQTFKVDNYTRTVKNGLKAKY